MLLQWPAQYPSPEPVDEGAHVFVRKTSVAAKAPREGSHIHPCDNAVGQLRVGVDVLEVDVQVVGGVGKPVCAEVSRQQSAGVFGDIHARGRAHGGDVLGHSQSTDPVYAGLFAVRVHGRINARERPARAALDPLLEQRLLSGRQCRAFLGHLILGHTLPHKALGWLAGHDHVRLSKGGELAGQIKIALGRGGVVAFEAVLGEQRRNLGFKERFVGRG